MITIPIKVTLLGIFIFSAITVFVVWKILRWAAEEDRKQYELQLFEKIKSGMTLLEVERVCGIKPKWVCNVYSYGMNGKDTTSLYVFSSYCFCYSCTFFNGKLINKKLR